MTYYLIKIDGTAYVSKLVEVEADSEEKAIEIAMNDTDDFEFDGIIDTDDVNIVSSWEDDD